LRVAIDIHSGYADDVRSAREGVVIMVRVPAKVRKEHEAQQALFDDAIKRAESLRDAGLALFSESKFYDALGDAGQEVSETLNGLYDLVSALEGQKMVARHEFMMYGVDPYQRYLVANNID
jgi:hypothetical protein